MINKIFYCLNHLYSLIVPSLSRLLAQSPFVLHIRITSKCNLSCPFCYLKEGLNQEEPDLLSIDEWKKILISIPRTTIIDITGAEPFMAKNFKEFLILLKQMGFKCSVTTNGTVYNDSMIDTIINSSIEYILISLDGMNKKHNELRGSSNAFERTEEFITLLKSESKRAKKKLIINVKTMLLDENIEEIIPLIRHCDSKVRPDIITVNLPFQNNARGGRLFENDFLSSKYQTGNTFKFTNPSKVIEVIKDIFNIEKSIKTPIIFKPSISKSSLIEYIKDPSKMSAKNCKLYKNNVTLYYDGTLTPCDISFKVSNIRELGYDLKKLYIHEDYKKFSNLMKSNNKACEGCVFSKQVKTS
nr:radical SAM protein [Halobacteriovorax sp. HLS]